METEFLWIFISIPPATLLMPIRCEPCCDALAEAMVETPMEVSGDTAELF